MISIHEGGLGVGWTRFTRAFGDFSDGGFENFQLGIGGADGDGSFLDADHDPHNAAAGHDFVAILEVVQHLLPLFLAPLLGHDQQKVKNRENEDERGEAEPAPGSDRLNASTFAMLIEPDHPNRSGLRPLGASWPCAILPRDFSLPQARILRPEMLQLQA